ncbi:SDR family oxidoreductase [Pendulispora brunnea]|uniref:SDR family oxidoreductase n=1 Tax=Pendulispora brunnea TaxID=2905690 RepID=A0ABZ2KKL6_9BACT
MDLGLSERVALVTGSSQGIGRATAELFAREGARVAVTYRRYEDKAEAVARAIRAIGGEALIVPLDLASGDSVRSAVDAVLAKWGRLDVLVNNAVEWGSRRPSELPPFEEVPAAYWHDVFRSNSEGHFAAIQAVLPSMRKRHWGRIVNVSSGLAIHGIPGSGFYSAAKSSLHGLTRALYRELAPDGILTNVVMAGATRTDHMQSVIPAAVMEHIAKNSPIGRLAEPEEVAKAIVFIGSAANTMINGEIVLASGGHM